MLRRHTILIWGILLVVLAGLAGCGTPAAASSGAKSPSQSPTVNLPQGVPLPDAVQVVRTDAINPLPPFDRSADNATAVQQLYRALYALPPFKAGPLCVNDSGMRFQITFSHQGSTALDAHFHATGCAFIQITPQDNRGRGVTNAFVSELATVLGVSRPVLLPPDGYCQCL